jgi:undecaprenyl-diphosphatase
MIETLIRWDRELFLFLNGFHSGFWDGIMAGVSNKFMWIPLYALFIYWLIRYYKKDSLLFILALILVVTVSDQLSVHAFKNVFMRLRPCHDPGLEGLVHIVNGKCGGQDGFYSGHATNHFAVAVFLLFTFRDHFRYFAPLILFWAAVISYSRIYLGVHFPGDVLAGAVAGSLLGYAAVVVLRKLNPGILVVRNSNYRN